LKNIIVVEAVCGTNHSAALSRKGDIYSWGKGEWSGNYDKRQNLSIMEAITPMIVKVGDC